MGLDMAATTGMDSSFLVLIVGAYNINTEEAMAESSVGFYA